MLFYTKTAIFTPVNINPKIYKKPVINTAKYSIDIKHNMIGRIRYITHCANCPK